MHLELRPRALVLSLSLISLNIKIIHDSIYLSTNHWREYLFE